MMFLNEEQQHAASVEHALPLKIIAGAGTGKTETLARRFVELVRSGVPPDRILMLTFTEEAAAEMRRRVLIRLADAELNLPSDTMAELWCHTFHGFALRLLSSYGWDVGLPPAPRILDTLEQQALLEEIVEEWENSLPSSGYRPLEHFSYRWDNGEAWNRANQVLSSIRDSGATPAELEAHPLLREQQQMLFSAERAQLIPLVEYGYRAYTGRLHEHGSLDYAEILVAACRLLARMPKIREMFTVVMVDEFQDTNPVQLDLLALLRPEWSAITVVGDPRQAIYGWRSARPDSLHEFPYSLDRPHHHQPLQHNYRSRAAIVDVANLALAGSEFGKEAPLLPRRVIDHDPVFESLAPTVGLYLLPTVEDEAQLVATEMRRLIDAGIPCNDLALLLRARTHLPAFATALEAAGIPYTVRGGTGFFRQPVVRLVASLLQFLLDPEDRNAAIHLLDSPLVGIDIGALALWCRKGGWADEVIYWQWLREPEQVPPDFPDYARVIERLNDFQRLYYAALARSLTMTPDTFLLWLVDASGLMQWWADAGDQQAQRDWDKLIALADRWSRSDRGLTVAKYTERLRQHISARQPEAVPIEPSSQSVEIATVHGAKGREWPVVFVADTALPSRRARQVEHVLWDDHWKLVIGDSKASAKKGDPDPLGDLRQDLRRRARNEERAIWYVALTRARDRLFITHSACTTDAQGHFVDAQSRVTSQETLEEDNVHFFHELWEHVQLHRERLGNVVLWEADANSVTPSSTV